MIFIYGLLFFGFLSTSLVLLKILNLNGYFRFLLAIFYMVTCKSNKHYKCSLSECETLVPKAVFLVYYTYSLCGRCLLYTR
jgi:hypothetical protein